MSFEIKQLVIKSNIANQTTKDSASGKENDTNTQPSGPVAEINQQELFAEVNRICKSLLDKELRKRKER